MIGVHLAAQSSLLLSTYRITKIEVVSAYSLPSRETHQARTALDEASNPQQTIASPCENRRQVLVVAQDLHSLFVPTQVWEDSGHHICTWSVEAG